MYVAKASVASVGTSANQRIKANFNGKIAYSQMDTAPAVHPSSENLQAYYLKNKTFSDQTSFGRLLVEHLENGAYVDEAKNVIFKLFTFKDVKKVFVEIKDKGTHELQKIEDGIFKRKILHSEVEHGDRYRFKLVKANGEATYCKDPYAMRRDSVLDDFSIVYDHNKYEWSDQKWMKSNNAQRISHRNPNSLSNLNIYEINIATLTKEGTFEAAKVELDKIVEKGFNAIHIMPVENTHSYNWGYDGVDKFAPQETFLGGPDKLKELIDYAHKKKLNVIMDVVPNHVGPDGNGLGKVAPYINTFANGQFGSQFNLEGDPANNKYVRDYLSNMCLNWLRNYHCDGLRLDMTKLMDSDYALKQIAMEVHYHHPDAILIAEDARFNLPKVTKALKPEEECLGKLETEHAKQIKRVDRNEEPLLDSLGMDSEWNFPLLHALEDAIFNRKFDGLDSEIRNSGSRVKYFASHDEIGNIAGTRLISKISNWILHTVGKVDGNDFSQQCIRAEHGTQALLKSKVAGEYDKFSAAERMDFLRGLHINQDITPDELDNAISHAIALQKVAAGNIFMTPGPKMVFQGDEKGALSYFKFFRELSPGEAEKDKMNLVNKGYEPGPAAFRDSKLDSINYSDQYKQKMDKLNKYTKDLTVLADRVPALRAGNIEGTMIHDVSHVHGVHLKKGKSEVFTVSNFHDSFYNGNYEIKLPKGKWVQIMNSDAAKYGGSGNYSNAHRVIKSDGENKVNISMSANSFLIFEKYPERT